MKNSFFETTMKIAIEGLSKHVFAALSRYNQPSPNRVSDQSYTPAFLLFVCWCVVILLWFLLWLKIKDEQKANKTLRELFSFTDFCYQTLMLNEEVVRRKWRRSGEACAEQRGKTHCMTDMVCNAYGILCLLFWPDTNGCWCQAV